MFVKRVRRVAPRASNAYGIPIAGSGDRRQIDHLMGDGLPDSALPQCMDLPASRNGFAELVSYPSNERGARFNDLITS